MYLKKEDKLEAQKLAKESAEKELDTAVVNAYSMASKEWEDIASIIDEFDNDDIPGFNNGLGMPGKRTFEN